ncbi:hypothetical protein P5630_11705 [Bacillus subtilis]|nr:hypothetical protein P5652_06775 [Bacillus subtilis]WGD68591.1 hypothetical protein P5630_11705 [Bacillus subtilis]WGD74440.1 hypothetical protein P5668_11630 [Bacillus subtilis]WGD89660.1 hypothetical protein P5665_11255 [Bacillus subtilis]
MATLNIYTLNTAEQLDLFLTQDGDLDLDYVLDLMNEKIAPISPDGAISGEGFINPQFRVRDDLKLIESYCASQGSLGYFNEARMEDSAFTTRRTQHHYYSKASLFITEKSDLVLKFDFTTEEGSKSKVKSLIEELGVEATIFRIDNDLMTKVQNKFEWSAVKLDKIEKDGDKTKRVSYEIDLADDQSTSQVDEDYRDYGKRSHISFELPYSAPGAPNKVSVKMYSQGNRIVIDEDELCNSPLEDFIVYLLNVLKGLKEEEV